MYGQTDVATFKARTPAESRVSISGARLFHSTNPGPVRLPQLPQESGIPFNTLRNWYYEQAKPEPENESYTENGTNVTPENNTESDVTSEEKSEPEIKICERCGNNPVEFGKKRL